MISLKRTMGPRRRQQLTTVFRRRAAALVSIIIPDYNERETMRSLRRVRAAGV